MKVLNKPTDLIHFSLSLPVVAGCINSYQSTSVQTAKSYSTMNVEIVTSWKNELLKRSTIAYVDHDDSTGFFYLQNNRIIINCSRE